MQESLFNKVALKLLNRYIPNNISVWSTKQCKIGNICNARLGHYRRENN